GVGEAAEVELGNELAGVVANLPVPHPDPGLVHARRDAVRRHHLERRRMEGAGAQVMRERGLALQHDDRNALPAERERAHQTGRAGPRDDDRQVGHAAPWWIIWADYLTSLVPVSVSRFL